jgi:hypothetical protein
LTGAGINSVSSGVRNVLSGNLGEGAADLSSGLTGVFSHRLPGRAGNVLRALSGAYNLAKPIVSPVMDYFSNRGNELSPEEQAMNAAQYGATQNIPPQPYDIPPQPYDIPPQPYDIPPQPYDIPPQRPTRSSDDYVDYSRFY